GRRVDAAVELLRQINDRAGQHDHDDARQSDVGAAFHPSLFLRFGNERVGLLFGVHFQRRDSRTLTVPNKNTTVTAAKKTRLLVAITPLLKSVYLAKMPWSVRVPQNDGNDGRLPAHQGTIVIRNRIAAVATA